MATNKPHLYSPQSLCQNRAQKYNFCSEEVGGKQSLLGPLVANLILDNSPLLDQRYTNLLCVIQPFIIPILPVLEHYTKYNVALYFVYSAMF